MNPRPATDDGVGSDAADVGARRATARPGWAPLPLAERTTWKVGGRATRALVPSDVADLEALVGLGEPVALLGQGSNVLVDDGDIAVPVVVTTSLPRELSVDAATGDVVASASVPLPKLARAAVDAGIEGFSFLAGIPGNVGGGVAMNAGLGPGGPSLDAVVAWVEVLDVTSGSMRRLDADELAFSYRHAAVHRAGHLVWRAGMRGRPGADPEGLRGELTARLAERRRKQPLAAATAGSVFLPLPDGRAAGEVVEAAGCVGLRRGGAVVSTKHANWIETSPGARAADVRAVVEAVQEVVSRRLGVDLRREVRYFPAEATHVGPLRGPRRLT